MRAVLYCRISKDDADDRLGVGRQEQDLRREAARRGADVSEVLIDNDLSGSGRVERPAFDRLIELIRSRDVDVVLSVDLDRLSRGWRPFVTLYEACEEARVTVAWLGGEANFATGTGLLEMELRASFAREELRKIRARTARKHRELAENGHDAGGGRPFGYEADRHTIRECEAAVVREAAERALSGEPFRTIAWDFNRRGIAPVKVGRWSSHALRVMLGSARIGGRREVKTIDGKRRMYGPITGTADWPGIISPEDSDRLRALIYDPARSTEARPRKYLLVGFLFCGRCGKQLHTSTARGGQQRSYECRSGPGFSDGCGRVRVNAAPVEDLVVDQLLRRVDEGAISKALKSMEQDPTVREDLAAVDARLSELADAYAHGDFSMAEWKRAREALVVRQQALQRQVEAQARQVGLDGLEAAPLRSEWPLMPLHRQRAVLRLLVGRVEILPAAGRGPVFDPKRVVIRWA